MDQRTTSTSITALAREHAIERYRSSIPNIHDIIYYLQILINKYFEKQSNLLTNILTSIETTPHYQLTLMNIEELININIFTSDYDTYCTARDILLINLSSASTSTSITMFTKLLTAQTFCKVRKRN